MIRYTFTVEPEPDKNGEWVPWARANYWIEELRAENAKLKADLHKAFEAMEGVPEPTEEKYEYYFELEGQKAHLATTEDFGDDIIEGLADGYAEEEWRKTERKLIWRSKAEAESGADPIGHLTRRPIGLSQSKEV